MNLDAFDRKILDLLQRNNRQSLQALAEQVNLSTSAVNRRVSVLEKAGLIREHVAVLDGAKVGRPLTVIAEVALASETQKHIEAAKKRFLACPQVQQLYYVTGDYDFFLIFRVRDMAEYEALTRELFFADSNIKRFQTRVVFEAIRAGMAVSLE